MKHIIILGDGMADHPIASLGGKTILQAARTPFMNKLAREGRVGLLHTVPDGFQPGSEIANLSLLGYDLPTVYEGRGVLEAASMGIQLADDEMAMRCNLICIENDRIKSHSAGHITTDESAPLVEYLNKQFALLDLPYSVVIHTGIQYRHLLVVKEGRKEIETAPPHDFPDQPFRPLLVKADIAEAQTTADLLNELIINSQRLLAEHPINRKRVAEGKQPANSIWPWSAGYRPKMQPLSARFPQIKNGSVISAVDLIKGIGRYAGLESIEVEGATGLYDTNYEGKVTAALEALKEQDFVFLHIEASDEAGHEGNIALKMRTVEDLDARVVRPVYEAVSTWSEPVSIAILPDHPTPCELRTHVSDPVPFLIYHPQITPDEVQTFDEVSVRKGHYGVIEGSGFIQLFMAE